MQISNNVSNTNFSGTFRIKPESVKAKAEIPAMFTQGCQLFRNITEKGDMVIVLRDNYDKRVGKYLQENNITNLEYYPFINTKSGLDDEKPEGLIKLLKDKTVVVKTGMQDILATIAAQKGTKKTKKYKAEKELKKIADVLRLNIENPIIESNKQITKVRDSQKARTIEMIRQNGGTTYVYVKPDSLNEDSIKCIVNGQGEIVKTFSTPNEICKFMKLFKELKNNNVNILT